MLALVFVGLLALLAPTQAGVANITQYFTGGLPFCTQCGSQGQYACSPDANGITLGQWNSGTVSFYDPIPTGNYPTKIVVNVQGAFSCNAVGARVMFGVTLNGFTHGVRDSSKGINACKCDTCDGVETFTFTFTNGVPSYYYRNYNSLKLVPYKDSLCVNKIDISITYDPTSSSTPLPERYFELAIPKEYDRVGCSVCNPGLNQWCSAYNNNTLTLSFIDPLPTNVYAISVSAFISLNMMERASTYYTTLAVALQSTSINTATLTDSGFRDKCGCMTDLQVVSAQYQRGWPGYVYSGANRITFTANKYSQSYGNICIGRIGVKIVYYSLVDFEKYGEPQLKEMIIEDVTVVEEEKVEKKIEIEQ